MSVSLDRCLLPVEDGVHEVEGQLFHFAQTDSLLVDFLGLLGPVR